jgi:hypothetical protein
MRYSGIAALAALCWAAPAAAQSFVPAISFELGMSGASLSGKDFEGSEFGSGLDWMIRFRSRKFSLGAGYLEMSHDIEEFTYTRDIEGYFVEPRFSFPTEGLVWSPFIMLRGATLTQYFDVHIDDRLAYLKSEGFSVTAGAGISLQFLFLATDLSVYYSLVSFDEFSEEADASIVYADTDARGSSVGFRLGVAVLIGKGILGGDR